MEAGASVGRLLNPLICMTHPEQWSVNLMWAGDKSRSSVVMTDQIETVSSSKGQINLLHTSLVRVWPCWRWTVAWIRRRIHSHVQADRINWKMLAFFPCLPFKGSWFKAHPPCVNLGGPTEIYAPSGHQQMVRWHFWKRRAWNFCFVLVNYLAVINHTHFHFSISIMGFNIWNTIFLSFNWFTESI